MVDLERRVVVKLPSYGEVMEEVKVELLRLVGENIPLLPISGMPNQTFSL